MKNEHEVAIEKARAMLARGWVVGVSKLGDLLCRPTEERVRELAALISSGVIPALSDDLVEVR